MDLNSLENKIQRIVKKLEQESCQYEFIYGLLGLQH